MFLIQLEALLARYARGVIIRTYVKCLSMTLVSACEDSALISEAPIHCEPEIKAGG